MKITFLTDSESRVNVFPALVESLREEIADLEAVEEFVPKKEDLPQRALELVEETDLLFVLTLYSEENKRIQMVLEKLIDVEIKTGIKIIKAFEESEVFELESTEEIELEKSALVEKWSSFLLNYLFNPDSFEPKK